MSVSEKFRKDWELKFPYDVVPEGLDFLSRPRDMWTLERCLDQSINKTDKLNTELEQQKFIAEFIMKLMDNADESEGQSDKVMSGVEQTRSLRTMDKPSGLAGDVKIGESRGRIRPTSKFYKECPPPSRIDVPDYDDEQRTYSFESPFTRKPGGIRGLLDKVKSSSVVRTTSEPNIAERSGPVPPPKQSARNIRQPDKLDSPKSFTVESGDISNRLPPHLQTVSDHKAEVVQNPSEVSSKRDGIVEQEPTVSEVQAQMKEEEMQELDSISLPTLDSYVLAGSGEQSEEESEAPVEPGSGHSASRRRPRRADLYEEAIPFVRSTEFGERVLSDEEQEEEHNPIYYSILLFKQETLDRAKLLYFNEKQSNKLERQARKLSLRYNQTERRNGAGNRTEGPSEDEVDHVTLRHKRQSMINALDDFSEGQSDVDELESLVTPLCVEEEKLQMRKSVITSILDSEEDYVAVLDSLMRYMQTFKNLADTAHSVLSVTDIDTIFLKIADLHKIHYMFIHALRPKVEKWSNEQEVAEIFHQLAEEEYRLAPAYLKNYQKALATVKKCYQENPQFLSLTKDITVKGTEKAGSLDEMLHKPVVRIQRNTLVLHDLINCTPPGHADYDLLQKTLKLAQKFLSDFENPNGKDALDYQRYLVKHGVVVEKVGSSRKLRNVFLFNDIFVCARQKISSRQRLLFETEWFIPLADLGVVDTCDSSCGDDEGRLSEAEPIRRKVINLQNDLNVEMKRAKTSSELQRQWSFRTHTKKKKVPTATLR